MKLLGIIILLLVLAAFLLQKLTPAPVSPPLSRPTWWSVQSVDTMKYSRDLAREKKDDPEFASVIAAQIQAIAKVGATHVSLGTPYDEEFLPFLRQWVSSARSHGLKVWFRGNWSGWEGWFDYPAIDSQTHLELTRNFIKNHRDLFVSGDIFTSCPECENGRIGDPRVTGDVSGFRSFLAAEKNLLDAEFSAAGLSVHTNFFSVNADVAKLVFDSTTLQELGNLVVIDHYVKTPEELQQDVVYFGRSGLTQVVLGEFGAPIPDLHGRMSQEEQAKWLDRSLSLLVDSPDLIGLNYWVATGGSSELWSESGSPRLAAATLSRYFSPPILSLTLTDELGRPVPGAQIYYLHRQFTTDSRGLVQLPLMTASGSATIVAATYFDHGFSFTSADTRLNIVLTKSQPSFWYRLQQLTHSLINAILPN